uniref:NAD(P)H-quinone oxidoreductase subunit 3, chloroplastic n=1 Tax=Asplenium komarovii TaxID=2559516 RepID=A0A8F4WD38_9MONI|nr:NADH-plastoquinone oxidoreductase subunit 3 [Asplenium komarovii]USW06969.1 NADH-plastoquinone oxidoreductase subunit 3 [Asplenium scolopendrium var. americanum]USW07057.1 NADH-plastoquinone oxidoreductase subunit 3 [Asplenium scolopendrium var. scolopendrium]
MFLLHQYDPFWVFLLVSISIPYLAFLIPGFIAPARKGPEKLTSYESGIEPKGDAWIRFQIRYYMFALVFVVFDVETIFLYPWAVSFTELGLLAFIEVIIFISILVVGLVHAWRKGASEWC